MELRGLFARAIQVFRHARSQAAFEQSTIRLTRCLSDLLSFEEVRAKFHITPSGSRKIQNILLKDPTLLFGRWQ